MISVYLIVFVVVDMGMTWIPFRPHSFLYSAPLLLCLCWVMFYAVVGNVSIFFSLPLILLSFLLSPLVTQWVLCEEILSLLAAWWGYGGASSLLCEELADERRQRSWTIWGSNHMSLETKVSFAVRKKSSTVSHRQLVNKVFYFVIW